MRSALLCLLLLAAAARAQDILVVTPEEFRPALEEWRKHRQAQGLVATIRAPRESLRGLVQVVHEESEGRLRYVLLLGDVTDVPCTYEQGKIIAKYDRDPRIANDNDCADLDSDGIPDLAIGRLPADNPAEAEEMLAKVVAYEKNGDHSVWRRRINVVAGVGGFGQVADFLIEQAATKLLTESVPAAYDVHVTYANENSPFCPYPPAVQETTLARFNEGSLFVTYIGHGSRLRLDRMHFAGEVYDIFDDEAVYALDAKHGPPIAFFVACSNGHMDGAPDCLAETAVKRPRGPVAVIAASRVSMPYGNGIFAKELLEAVFLHGAERLGDAVRDAKMRVMRPVENDVTREGIEQVAGTFYQRDGELRARERLEHLYLYNLFGDPSLRLPRPAEVAIECAAKARPSAELAVAGSVALEGEALVELVAERTPLVPKRRGDTREDFEKTYANANAWTKASVRAPVKDGAFAAKLALPGSLRPGAYHVRVYVEGKSGAAVGSRKVTLVAPEEK